MHDLLDQIDAIMPVGLTGRVVRANNTMRVAKSWGHNGGPVPAEWLMLVHPLR